MCAFDEAKQQYNSVYLFGVMASKKKKGIVSLENNAVAKNRFSRHKFKSQNYEFKVLFPITPMHKAFHVDVEL